VGFASAGNTIKVRSPAVASVGRLRYWLFPVSDLITRELSIQAMLLRR
jgi:hypothetical protein